MGHTLVEHIAQMLLLARPGGEGGAPPPRPWFAPALLVASCYSLCGKSSLEENRRALWDKVGAWQVVGTAPSVPAALHEANGALAASCSPH